MIQVPSYIRLNPLYLGYLMFLFGVNDENWTHNFSLAKRNFTIKLHPHIKQIIANLPSARAAHLISPRRMRHSAITVQYGGEYENRTRLSGVTSQYSSRWTNSPYWSDMRESNPRPKLGRLLCYLYTNTAYLKHLQKYIFYRPSPYRLISSNIFSQ